MIPASRPLTWPVSLFGSGMEQGFDWKNLEQNKMPALKFICQQHSIRVTGKTKRDYVNAIAEYRNQQNRAFVPPPPRPDQVPIKPELQALTRTQRTHTLSDLHHAKTIQRFHDNERRLQMKITPNAFQQPKPVVPPTPPKPAQPINFLRQPVYNSRRSPPCASAELFIFFIHVVEREPRGDAVLVQFAIIFAGRLRSPRQADARSRHASLIVGRRSCYCHVFPPPVDPLSLG